MSSQKEPFEKLRSLLERKKLFEACLDEKAQFLIKTPKDALIIAVPVQMAETTLVLAAAEGSTGVLQSAKEECIGNFGVGTDRFFFHGPVTMTDKLFGVDASVEIFKLQRRKTMRVAIPESLPIYANIMEVAGQVTFFEASVFDVSAGGARIYFKRPPPVALATGNKLKLTIHPPSGKSIETYAEIKHIQAVIENGQQELHYGIQFTDLKQLIIQRLAVLTMDIQQRIIIGR